MRNKRFQVKKPGSVTLIIETGQGNQYTFTVQDLSVTGLFCVIEGEAAAKVQEEISDDTIVASSKVLFEKEEAYLGRLAVQRRFFENGVFRVGFSTIDSKVPLDGKLSRFIELNFHSEGSVFDVELPAQGFNLASFLTMDLTNADIFDRAQKFNHFYEDWKKSDRFAYMIPRTSMAGARVNLDRTRDGDRSDFLMFGTNDYLGLSHHPEVLEAAIKSIEKYGFGSTGTHTTSGTTDAHEELAFRVARLYGKEDALVYSSGYNTNVGIIAGIAREQDLLVADINAHASMHDGMAMSRATVRIFKHNDMDHLRKVLAENRDKYGGCMILTEGAFSMDGSLGDLKTISEIANEYNARTYVDQGHCFGVLGNRGLGTSEVTNTTNKIDLIVGLFSKAIGTMGGFVVGRKDVMNWLRSYSRSYMFGTSFPPSVASASLAAIDIITRDRILRDKLRSNIQHFIRILNRRGIVVPPDHTTPIIPILIGDEVKIGKIFKAMMNDGVFALPVVYPVVARNKSRFRFSITTSHSISDLEYAVNSLERAAKAAGVDLVEAAATLTAGKPQSTA